MRLSFVLLFTVSILACLVCGCGRETASRQSQWEGDTTMVVTDPPHAAVPGSDKPTVTPEHRILHPMSGRILRLPADREPAAEAPSSGPSKPADPQQPKPEPRPEPEPHRFGLQWEAPCSVERAYDAAADVLVELGLAEAQYQTQRVRNPRTGRIETRRMPNSGMPGRNDGLSAMLQGRTTAGIDFHISILLAPPASSTIAIEATSKTHPEDVLERQTLYLKDRISEAIAAEPAEPASLPYPSSLMLDRPVNVVADTLYRWAEEQGFDRDSGGRDQYYRMLTARSGSGIQFEFTLRLVEPERTKLDLEVSEYEDKPEFELILRRLIETLDMLQGDPAERTEAEPAPYPETLMLPQTPETVAQLISKWAQEAHFERENSEGDDFYRYLRYETGSGIRLYFYLRLVEPNTTKLNIRVTNFENKEEFGMILQSLEAMLEQMEPAATGETAG